MKFYRTTLETCADAAGLVIVVDVLRAFSTAAYAFSAGASRILPVGTVAEAFQLRERFPDYYLMGELHGGAIEGFDINNSPTELIRWKLSGKGMIQRTSAGTQGIIRSRNADMLLTASFVVAGATAGFIRQTCPEEVTFVLTGVSSDGYGDEDVAFADYLEQILDDPDTSPQPYLERVHRSRDGLLFSESGRQDFPISDMDYCTAVSRFDFAMRVDREDGLLIMKPFHPEAPGQPNSISDTNPTQKLTTP